MRRNMIASASHLAIVLAAAAPLKASAQPVSQEATSRVSPSTAGTPPSSSSLTHALGSDENILNEIVVTGARRRSESVQQTPLSITAITATDLDRHNISSLGGIQNLTPALHIHRQQSSSDVAAIFLRGFGTHTNDPAINPAISIYIDGVYQASVNGSQLDLFDIQSLEVLKGPQGTLFGKNSTAGVINITTKRPTGDFSGEAQLKYEKYGRIEARAIVNVPIVKDVLAAKVSILRKHGGDYINVYDASAFSVDPLTGHQILDPNGPHKRSMGGDNIWSGRVGLNFTPSPNFDWYVSGEYNRFRNPQAATRALSALTGADITPISYPVTLATPVICAGYGYCSNMPAYSTAASYRTRNKSDTYSVASTMNLRTDPVVITAVTGYRHYDGVNYSDIEGLPVPFFTVTGAHLNLKQFSQELRFSSQKNGGLDLGGKLDWVAGLYYFKSSYRQTNPVDLFGGASGGGISLVQLQTQQSKSYAAFLHGEFHATDQWSVSFGGRQTWDSKRHKGIAYFVGAPAPALIPANDKWRNFSIEAGTSYKIDRDKMVYFRYAEGYRGGGMQNYPTSVATAASYQPETSKSLELGLKTDWLDHRLRVNVDLYHNKFNNLQVDVYSTGLGGATVLQTQNAASATVKGVEVSTIVVPVDRLTLRGNFGYISAKYKNYFADLIGNGIITDNSNFKFGYTPKWEWSLGADFIVVDGAWGKISTSADYSWRARHNVNIVDFPGAQQRAYGLADFSVRYDDPSSRFYGSIYAENAFAKHYLVNLEPVSGLSPSGTDGTPRVFGATIGVKF